MERKPMWFRWVLDDKWDILGTLYHPDIPYQVLGTADYRTADGALPDMVKHDGSFFTDHVSLLVNEKDADKLKPYEVLESSVSAKDRTAVTVVRSGGYRDDNADAAFDAIDMTGADNAKRRMVKDVLLQCVALGLSATKAESIRARLNLPEGGDIGPGDTRGGPGV